MRSFLKYHGSKASIAQQIIGYMPTHSMYVEPFGGGFSVGFAKRPVKSEVYNDLESEVFNLFRTVRERGDELAHLINMTPYSREELMLAYEPCECSLERARRFYVRAWIAIKTTSHNKYTGFRAAVNSDDNCSHALSWSKSAEVLLEIRKRLARVVIENCNAFDLFDRYDFVTTLWYLDPPYLNATRGSVSIKRGYLHNMTDDEHLQLCQRIKKLKGMVMLSGYDNDLYNEQLIGWQKAAIAARDDANKNRVECLWMNFASGRQLSFLDY